MSKAVRQNPLVQMKGVDAEKLHVSFLSEVPAQSALKELAGFAALSEQLRCIGRELYLYCPQGYGRSRLAKHERGENPESDGDPGATGEA